MMREGVSIDRQHFFASHSIVSYAGPLQRRLELLQYGIHDIIRHMRREIQFQPRSRRLADGYKLRGAKSQVCDRQERRSAT